MLKRWWPSFVAVLEIAVNVTLYDLGVWGQVIFVVLVFIQFAILNNKIVTLERLIPSLELAGGGSQLTTFYIYETQEEIDRQAAEEEKQRALHAARYTSSYPEIVRIFPRLEPPTEEEEHHIGYALIKNIPIRGQAGATVTQSGAIATFHAADGKVIVGDMRPRWWDEKEQAILIALDRPSWEATSTTIPPGEQRKLALVSKHSGAKILFAYNADSHDYSSLRKPEFRLGRGPIYVSLQLTGDGVEPKNEWAKITSTKDGLQVTPIKTSPWKRRFR